jgi:hypothetical protein
VSTWRVSTRHADTGRVVYQDVEGVQYAEPAFRAARALLAAKAMRQDLRFEECRYRELRSVRPLAGEKRA